METIKLETTKQNFKPIKIKTIPNEHYVLTDSSGKPLNKVKMVQVEKDLEVYTEVEGVETKVATLDSYYSPNVNASLGGLEGAQELGYLSNAKDGWMYLDELPATELGFAFPFVGVGAGLAGAGAIVVAGSGGGSSSGTLPDTTAPEAPVITSGLYTNKSTPIITGTAEVGSKIKIVIGGSSIYETIVGTDGTWSVDTKTTPLSGPAVNISKSGTSIVVTATDSSNNTSLSTVQLLTYNLALPISGYEDNIGVIQSSMTIVPSTDDTMPGFYVGELPIGARSIFLQYKLKSIEATYDPVKGIITPQNPIEDGTHDFLYQYVLGMTTYTSPTAFRLKIDTTPPKITIDDITTDNMINLAEKTAGVNVTGKTDAENGQIVKVVWGNISKDAIVNEGVWSVRFENSEIPTDGVSSILANVSDMAGNPSLQTSKSVTVDTIAPNAGILSLANYTDTGDNKNDFISSDKTFDLVLNGNEVDSVVTYKISTDGINWKDTTASLVDLVDGKYQFKAIITDKAGNSSQTPIISIEVDTTPPKITIDDVTTDNMINLAEKTAGVNITGKTDAQNGQIVKVVWGNVSKDAIVNEGVWSIRFEKSEIPTDGVSSILANVSDTAGNISSVTSKTITVDTLAPNAPVINTIAGDNTINANEQTSSITGTSEANATINLTIGSNTRTVTADASGVWSYTLTSADITSIGQGTKTISVTQTDTAGNISSVTSKTITVDTTPPTSSVVADTLLKTQNATVQSSEIGTAYIVNTNVTVTDLASITSAADNVWNSVSITTANTNTNLALTGLVDGTYKVYTVDSAGNLSSVSANSITVYSDTTPPTLVSSTPADNSFISSVSSNLTFTFSEKVIAGTGYIKLYNSSNTLIEQFDVSSSTNITGWNSTTLTLNPTNDLSVSTGYYIKIDTTAITDLAGNAYAGITDTTSLNFATLATGGGVNLSDIAAGNGGFVINGSSIGDNSGLSVSSAGDVNGDGIADLIVGAYNADPAGGTNAGRSYVVFGKSSNTTAIELSAVATGNGGFVINGQGASAYSGSSVSSAGDVNGDGLADLIVGAYGSERSYVVFGKSSNTTAVELSVIAAGNGGFVINGQCAGDWSGYSVSSAGDVNGDGLADLIVGAIYSDPGAVPKTEAGRSYVVFGKTNSTAIDLSAVAAGVGGFVINGQAAADYSGCSVSSAGDVNGDGIADLIVGAPFANGSGGAGQYGKSYVVFGQTGTTAINLSAIAAGVGGFIINGQSSVDRSGWSVSSAGDVNGDGLADLIVGAYWSDPAVVGGGIDAGRSYVVYGKTNTTAVDFSAITAGVGGFMINGQGSCDYSGRSVSSAGDINGDGLADLIVGASYSTAPAGTNAGRSYVIFGGTQFTTTVDYLGGTGADTFAGTSAAETFVLGAGDDKATASGADVVYAGAGNDTITIDSSMITALSSKYGAGGNTTQLAMIDGGGGFDTIALSGGTNLDLTAISNIGASGIEENSRIESIEKIDLKTDTSANKLVLTSKDVQDMSQMNLIHLGISADGNTWASGTYTLSATMQYHQLVISGASGDSVNIMETTWSSGGTVTSNGITYNVYTNTTAKTQVFVESGVSVNLNSTPLMLDLNGDGVHTTSLDASNVVFDNDANGIAEHMAWSDGKDGFLVLDINKDGIINNGSELFGSGTTLANGTKAKDGYEALRQYDDNHDNVIDVNDNIFSQLQIWVDKNKDGITTNDELKSLKDLNISSLNLITDGTSKVDNGNLLGLVSSYTKTDGTKSEMVDAWFATEATSNITTQTPVVVYNAPVITEEEKKETSTF